jgi:peptide chain release factor 1
MLPIPGETLTVLDKLQSLANRFQEVEAIVSDGSVAKDPKKYAELMRERSYLEEVNTAYERYKSVINGIEDAKLLSREDDAEIKEMAKEELRSLEAEKVTLEDSLKLLLIPPDPLNEKNIIMEIRAGTGGDEAALFVADLYRMYSHYAETKNWKIEIMSSNETELGGFKEISFSISGKNVYENMRYEAGVHRVQRVPETEASGRIHTSAVTVAVLPEAEETEIDIRQEDLRIDVCRSSGPGGQCVNTTDSAVRITHLPTGLVVHCQDEKSQLKNKNKALRILRARLFEMEEEKRNAERAADRKSQVGSGDRSERIRTYNFPQNRLTDHRVNVTLYSLDRAMMGEIDEVVEALKLSAREERLKATESA